MQIYVVARFTAALRTHGDAVSAVASRITDVLAVSYLPQRSAPEGEVVFCVEADGFADSGRAAVSAFGAALVAAGAEDGRLLAVRASIGPDWIDPTSLDVRCTECGPDHPDVLCCDCGVCAEAMFERFIDDLLAGGGAPVALEVDLTRAPALV